MLAGSLALPTVTPAPAYAEGLPISPTAEATRERWMNPNVRELDANAQVHIELSEVPSAIDQGAPVKLQATIRNNSAEKISNLKVQVRHADAEASLAQTREVLAADPSAYPYQAAPIDLGTSVDAGQEAEVTFEVPIDPKQREGLRLKDPGQYPILVALEQAGSTLSTQRFLLSVREKGKPQDSEAQALTVVVPLSAPIDALGGETGEAPGTPPLLLRSEDLARALSAGGQLESTLSAFDAFAAAYPTAAAGTCLGIDPGLVRTVARMADGYKVAEQRPSVVSQKQRLRDSWGNPDATVDSTEGTGQEVARVWLDRLRQVAQHSCTVPLPWANADLNAVAATNNEWLMREALQRGNATLSQVLGAQPLQNLVIPGSGYVTERTAPALGWADQAAIPTSEYFDPLGQAWFQEGAQPSQDDAGPASSLEQLSPQAPQHQAPVPKQPVRALVADNTVWGAAKQGNTALLAERVVAKTYQGSLAAMLSDASAAPQTNGFSNYDTRFDARLDSLAAREATASAAVELEATHSDQPVMLMLPADASSPKQVLNTVGELVERGQAKPRPLSEYAATEQSLLDDLRAMPTTDGQRHGAPFDDPTVVSDTEISRARQQADYIDDLTDLMVPDPAVAIGPYSFTAPLRQEVLRALSVNGRQSIATFDATVERENALLNQNRETLTALRSSVTLLPPGNVYTRWSDSSPLLIAARNGLPLPVDARIRYSAPEGARIDVDERLLIPAKGSITAQMTATLPEDSGRTDIDLWLATPTGAAISNPVTIGVQTRSGLLGNTAATAAIIIGLVGLLAFGVWRRRRARAAKQRRAPRPPHTFATTVERRVQPPRRTPRREPRNTRSDGQ